VICGRVSRSTKSVIAQEFFLHFDQFSFTFGATTTLKHLSCRYFCRKSYGMPIAAFPGKGDPHMGTIEPSVPLNSCKHSGHIDWVFHAFWLIYFSSIFGIVYFLVRSQLG
jgi:hypothetical protein